MLTAGSTAAAVVLPSLLQHLSFLLAIAYLICKCSATLYAIEGPHWSIQTVVIQIELAFISTKRDDLIPWPTF